MSRIKIETSCKKIAADLYTPVGIYLRMRDRFRDSILLESTDSQAGENSRSVIGINAIGGIEIISPENGEYKYPGEKTVEFTLSAKSDMPAILKEYTGRYETVAPLVKNAEVAQGLFGYMSYESVQFFENITFPKKEKEGFPLLRYRLYRYVIIFDHFRDDIYLCENNLPGEISGLEEIENILKSRDVPVFGFTPCGPETGDITDEDYRDMVTKGIAACKRGDVFQVVLSRSFRQKYKGDEFNVYRRLRSINPGPYLFYFDYGDYRLMGSSPESQLLIENDMAVLHPIAGTFRRTGDDEKDKLSAVELENDPKENAEHIMLVDLARNDLSRVCTDVEVLAYKEIKFYSHVIHMVSKVGGKVAADTDPFKIMGAVFPAGTLSGAPKHRAMKLIAEIEKSPRDFYGGTIGYIGFNNSCNHAIMIRSVLCRNNTLSYRAGAGVTAASVPENELQEVNNKLMALKKAIGPGDHQIEK